MALKYGDPVVLIQKSRDGTTRRVNAHVLDSVLQPDGAENFSPKQAEQVKALKGSNGKPLPGGQYVDVAFPDPGLVREGQRLTTRLVEHIYRLAYSVGPWSPEKQIGWELPSNGLPSAADLDAIEAEKKIAEATSGKVRQIKGK